MHHQNVNTTPATTTTVVMGPSAGPTKAKKAAMLLIPAALFTFACWCVFLGGLASLQHQCHERPASQYVDGVMNLGSIDGFSAGIADCHNVFQFWWWIIALEFVLLVSLIATSGAGKGFLGRHTFLGLFVVATVLYILASHVFLQTMSLEYFHQGGLLKRARATIAGAILTAIANFVMIMVLGHPGHSDDDFDTAHYNHKPAHYEVNQVPVAVQRV